MGKTRACKAAIEHGRDYPLGNGAARDPGLCIARPAIRLAEYPAGDEGTSVQFNDKRMREPAPGAARAVIVGQGRDGGVRRGGA